MNAQVPGCIKMSVQKSGQKNEKFKEAKTKGKKKLLTNQPRVQEKCLFWSVSHLSEIVGSYAAVES
jgi:hypothetical protein